MSTPPQDVAAEDPFAGLPLLIPVPRAAKLLGISRAAAYRFASAGDLPTKRLGRRVYVVSAKPHQSCPHCLTSHAPSVPTQRGG